MTTPKRTDGGHLTAPRTARLIKLLTLLGKGSQKRETLMKKLKLDERSFYRDVESLRELGVVIVANDTKYDLVGELKDALAVLPMPGMSISIADARVLARGTTSAHRKFQQLLDSYGIV
jgi:hypothetical protein